ncbi:hypothetical protein JAAARDRAFT_38660 [Jaapia argillacea MUCL 33604]|uniref:Uncharacterized protein n=1 Tax=Jaapia argillacea MUCL 33604 TaxID=933084 RepID=A0A067PUN8_9AGAM|nr:hypothetical protein JAAARDRAFT_38660 [Jaapia argillacea MUCL 33604]
MLLVQLKGFLSSVESFPTLRISESNCRPAARPSPHCWNPPPLESWDAGFPCIQLGVAFFQWQASKPDSASCPVLNSLLLSFGCSSPHCCSQYGWLVSVDTPHLLNSVWCRGLLLFFTSTRSRRRASFLHLRFSILKSWVRYHDADSPRNWDGSEDILTIVFGKASLGSGDQLTSISAAAQLWTQTIT